MLHTSNHFICNTLDVMCIQRAIECVWYRRHMFSLYWSGKRKKLAARYIGMNPTSRSIFSHLIFANNSFLFDEASHSMMLEIKRIFDLYSCWLGQEVNFSKKSILLATWKGDQLTLARSLGLIIMVCNAKHLGRPLFIGRSAHSSYRFLLKMDSKLTGWSNMDYITHGRRPTLRRCHQFLPMIWWQVLSPPP